MSIYTLKKDPFSSHSLVASEILKINPARILDIGCATGLIARAVSSLSGNTEKHRLWGIDKDAQAVKQAKSHYRRVWNMDIEQQLPSAPRKFDCIVCADVLEHLVNPWNSLRKIVECLLTNDGTVLISLPNVANWYIRTKLLTGTFNYQKRGLLDRTHLRFFTKESADKLIEQTNLTCLSFTATPIPLPIIWKQTSVGNTLFPIHVINHRISRLFPTLFGYQLLYICKKK